MSEELPNWLCPIIKLTEHNGDVTAYLNAVFNIFKKDFIDNKINFQGKVILYDKNDNNGKPNGFVHITTEGDRITKERNVSLRRCERIGWVKLIIENSDKPEVLMWKKDVYSPNKKWVSRIFLFLEKQDFLVILEELKNGFLMITAIYVDSKGQKRKHLKDYRKYIKQARQ